MITINKVLFGNYKGKEIYKYSLKNENDFQVNVLNYGGTITEIFFLDSKGIKRNLVLGYNNFEKYIKNGAYPGMIIGRTAGRIENGQFVLKGQVYVLNKNNGENSIHGGKSGLNDKVFEVKEIKNGIELCYESPHLEEGYPGNVQFKIRYIMTKNNELVIDYEGESDRKTYINLTNHSYFNLSGDKNVNGDEQFLQIDAGFVCELKSGLIPTGKLLPVENSVFDLRKGIIIKNGIQRGQEEKNTQFEITRAYDHPFVLEPLESLEKPQVVLISSYSGIKLEVFTEEKTAVVYTGNFLDECPDFDNMENGHIKNNRYLGVAIETQHYPNGINERNFGYKLVDEKNKYTTKTIFKFSNL